MSIGGFFKAIGHGVKVVAVGIAHGFAALFGKETAQAFANEAANLLKSSLGQIVVAEVEALSEAEISGTEKQAEAQKAVLEKAKEAGLSVSGSLVNMLIELAVQFLKGTLGKLEVAPRQD